MSMPATAFLVMSIIAPRIQPHVYARELNCYRRYGVAVGPSRSSGLALFAA